MNAAIPRPWCITMKGNARRPGAGDEQFGGGETMSKKKTKTTRPEELDRILKQIDDGTAKHWIIMTVDSENNASTVSNSNGVGLSIFLARLIGETHKFFFAGDEG